MEHRRYRAAVMSRDLLILTAVALLVRILVALVTEPAPWTDSAYYLVSGRQIAGGDGLTVPFIWSFLETGGRLPADPVLPIPSHAHWMPMTAFAAALGMLAGGMTDLAARTPFLLLSTAMTPAAYVFAWSTWQSRFASVAAGVMVIFAGPLLLFGSIVESYAIFGLAGAGALHAAMRSVAEPDRRIRWLVISGVLIGVATLARIEGVLLAVAPATAWLIGMRWTRWGVEGRRTGWLAGFAAAGGFLVVTAPWAARNFATFGSALPSTGGHTLWIKAYNEQFSITADTSLEAYLAQGTLTILGQKLDAWLTIGGYTLALLAGVLGIFFVAGLWIHRRRPDVAPFLVYWLVMFAVMGGVFTFHAPHGLFYHHASAWIPLAAPLAVMSVPPVATAASRWWRFLGRPSTHRFLVITGVVVAIPFSVLASAIMLAEWNAHLRGVQTAAAFLASRPDHERVLYRDAPLLAAASGHQVIGMPYDPSSVIDEVARAYDVTWFVAQRQVREPRIEPQGLWEGGRTTDVHGDRFYWLAEDPTYADDAIRIYRVRGGNDAR